MRFLFHSLTHLIGLRLTRIAARGRSRRPLGIGMDDWQGSIGTSDSDRLWPVTGAARPFRTAAAIRHRRLGHGRWAQVAHLSSSRPTSWAFWATVQDPSRRDDRAHDHPLTF